MLFSILNVNRRQKQNIRSGMFASLTDGLRGIEYLRIIQKGNEEEK
jgi:hypothetical protein